MQGAQSGVAAKCQLFAQVHLKTPIICQYLEEEEVQEDAREVQQGKPYHWKDWSIIRGRDCLYIWSDAAALELSNGSNGWFRFILDGKLATMYSSGSPEGGSDSSGTAQQTSIRTSASRRWHCSPDPLSVCVCVCGFRVSQRVPGEAAASAQSGEAGDGQSAHPVQRGSHQADGGQLVPHLPEGGRDRHPQL